MRKTPLTKSLEKEAGSLEKETGVKFFASNDELIEYLESDKFLERSERICRWVVRGTKIDWEALLSEAYLKVRKSPSFLKVRDEDGFFRLFVVASINLRNSRFRKARRAAKLFEELPNTEITKADPSVDLETALFVREFMERIERIRDERRRRALKLRLKGNTFRKVGEQVGCSHVAVKIWLKDAVEAFLDGREL